MVLKSVMNLGRSHDICIFAEELAHSNELASSLQQDINILYHRVSMDHDFLEKTLKPTFGLDVYIRQLWNIYSRVKDEGIVQPIVLGLNRSDYMLHASPEIKENHWDLIKNTKEAARSKQIKDDTFWSSLSLRQVEVNMVATSFCGLSPRMVTQHRQVLALMGFTPDYLDRVPECKSVNVFVDALARATELYVDHIRALSRESGDIVPCILVVVSEHETNIYDQRALLGALLIRYPRIGMLVRSFSDLAPHTKRMTVDEQRRLFVDVQEIAVVYYRHGYVPEHFPSDEIWEVKYQLERSRAIKCPCVQYLLANTKLIQATLSQPAQLARFIDPKNANFDRLLATFARQYPLSDAFGLINAGDMERLLEECRSHPERFVLKPQREGGGNNFFDEDIIKQLEHIMDQGLGATYVLMERFYPYVVQNNVIGWENPGARKDVVLELGIFGAIIASAQDIIVNEDAGHLLRTKSVHSNEGGIAAGFGCLDSPFLV
ncbi:unnamed protein product [Echinostoma caproni]|uniref:Glutathione synthetase n=1 Tax=Echinostoma caproni TaxID=27848 RepID=A0A3P8GTV4_9TREM|nr:unnamed protein product [Echinostoma caproni]